MIFITEYGALKDIMSSFWKLVQMIVKKQYPIFRVLHLKYADSILKKEIEQPQL